MATNEVEIELKLTGAEEAVEGFQEIGETSKAMAERFTNDNDKLGEGLGDLTGNVQGVIGSVKGLSTALSTSGQGFMALIGPIGAVVAAGYALYETFLNISGAAQEAEDRTEAMAAAAGDLQSKLEALAEKGVVLTTEELRRFSRATLQEQIEKEYVQKRIEKLTPKYTELTEAQEGLTRAQKTYEEGNIGDVLLQSIGWTDDLTESRQRLVKANQALNQSLDKILPTQIEANKKISEAAKLEKEAEEQSDESRLARIKENQTRLDTIKLLQAETKLTEEQAKVLDVQQKTKRALLELDLERNKENAQYLKDLDERLKREVKTLEASNKARSIITARGEKEVEDIRQAAREKQKAEEEKARAQRQARRRAANAKAMAMARQRQAEESQIRALGYEKLRLDGVDQLELLELQYKDSLKLAGDNANKKLIVEMAYQNSLQKLQQEQEAKDKQKRQEQARLEAEQQRTLAEQRQAFIQSTIEFDNQRIEDETERQLAQLEHRYSKEIALNEYSQEQITELQRRYSIERQEIEKASIDSQIEKVGEFTSMYSAGLAEAAYNSLLFGESFQESVGEMLVALGRQAAVESLMETAKGTAALFLPGGQALAAGHFKAAGLFAGAAAVAGTAGKAFGGGSSGGVGGGGDTSPTGTPQTAPTPQREQADTQAMVFNINFGGAVIYDTQRAAEQALADRITNLQNTRRRGAPRRSM
jgi:hypothetical protein